MPRGSFAVLAASGAEISAAWIGAGVAVLVALIGGVFMLAQQRVVRRTEREKLELSAQLERERERRQDQRQADVERERSEAEFQARLRDEEERADAAEQSAIAYRRQVVDRLRHLKILDMAKPLNLEELYVQLHVREEEPPRFGADLEGAADDPERLLRLSQERVRSVVSAAVSPEEALTRYRRFVALGDPGAGKTTMLRHLTFRIAREEAGPGLTLPVYVELRGFVDSGASDLLGYVAAEWRHLYGFADAPVP